MFKSCININGGAGFWMGKLYQYYLMGVASVLRNLKLRLPSLWLIPVYDMHSTAFEREYLLISPEKGKNKIWKKQMKKRLSCYHMWSHLHRIMTNHGPPSSRSCLTADKMEEVEFTWLGCSKQWDTATTLPVFQEKQQYLLLYY